MPFLSLSRRALALIPAPGGSAAGPLGPRPRLTARPLRATTVSLAAFLVALLAGTVAVAAGTGSRARAETATAPAPVKAVVRDGLAAEQLWASARDERLAALRQAEAVASRTATTMRPSRSRATPRTTPLPRPAPVVTAAAAPAPPVVAAVSNGTRVWPAAGALTGWFAERRGGARHTGIDIDGGTGDPVVAAAAGTVTWAGGAPAGYSGYGIVVIVDHGDGVSTVYAHLSAVRAGAGTPVGAGDRVGSVGSTGHSTGSHLHFEVRRGGVPVDPLAWLPPR